jgi:hypothetical protein
VSTNDRCCGTPGAQIGYTQLDRFCIWDGALNSGAGEYVLTRSISHASVEHSFWGYRMLGASTVGDQLESAVD